MTREGGDRPVRIGLSNEAIPRDLDGRRPESRRCLAGPALSVVGPGRARACCLVGGLTSTTVHFPRALGTPAASCQPPLFTFARSFHLHLLPHYLLLIVSGERLSFCLPVCLSLAFFFSFLSFSFSFFPLLYFSPIPILLSRVISGRIRKDSRRIPRSVMSFCFSFSR